MIDLLYKVKNYATEMLVSGITITGICVVIFTELKNH